MWYSKEKSEIFPFLFRLLAWTAVLGFLWQTILYEYYLDFLRPIAFAFLRFVGAKKLLYSRVGDQFVNLVLYLALVMASPGLIRPWKRTLLAATAGTAVICVEHLFLSWAVYSVEVSYIDNATRELFVIPMWLISAALPFVLWMMFCSDSAARLLSLRPER